MSVTLIVQARMGSTRLPGKVLADLGGVPLLAFMLRRLAPLDVDHLVVATGTSAADDPIEEVAAQEGAAVVRGDERDVLSRAALALARHPATVIARLTADCPLIDPAVVHAALDLRARTDADYVSNTLIRTFPDGLDVEVMTAAALAAAAMEATDPIEREHVTPFVYRRPQRFLLRALRHDAPLGHLRWTVDTPDDLTRIEAIVAALDDPRAPWQRVLAVAEGDGRDVDRDVTQLQPAMPADSDVVRALRNDPATVRWTITARAVTAHEHARWFAERLYDPGHRLWIARRAGDVVGDVSVRVREGVGTVSIAVAEGHRGRGTGTEILAALDAALRLDEQVHTLEAQVHLGNAASQRLFAGAGYEEVGREGSFVTLRRRRR